MILFYTTEESICKQLVRQDCTFHDIDCLVNDFINGVHDGSFAAIDIEGIYIIEPNCTQFVEQRYHIKLNKAETAAFSTVL